MLNRAVQAELLDGLPASDPAAVRSRRDLARIHVAMGTRRIVARGLLRMSLPPAGAAPFRMLELGAGDGRLLLDVARTLASKWPRVALTLLDRQSLVADSTIEGFAELGWTAEATVVDVFDWARAASTAGVPGHATAHWDVVVTNLFLHHFDAGPLELLMAAVATRADRFLACEPRRHWTALAGSHLVGAIGANAVTRCDAVLSVRAGFRDAELTSAWHGQGAGWRVNEYEAGMFSHCFCAERIGNLR